MAPALPLIKQVPSPNYSPTPIAHDLVVVHLMEGGYLGSVNWLCRSATRASAHLCMNDNGSEFTQLVPLNLMAWAQCKDNRRGVSIEAPGFTAKGVADVTLRALARAAAWICRAYGIAPVWAEGGRGRGVCSHHDLGVDGGGHVDICGVGDATWLKFMAIVKEEYDAFGDGPLPAWALHGAPAPHAVALPPDVPPEASHGGAIRCEPGAVALHPTESSYPHGSAADLQWHLNQAGAAPPLVVDGHAGPLTRAALRAFQTSHGLVVDGLIGPLTWAALEKATTPAA